MTVTPTEPLTPAEVARTLRRPPPTAEQQQVITAPLAPGLVVAGAGSGKTETMASRVVWLVATGQVAPDEVLGLTFTRKAAGELATRVRSRLDALAEALGRPAPQVEPTVMTYDAFAGRVVAEHGMLLGIEPDRRLLTPAGAWQRAARLVHAWDGPMEGVDAAPDTVVTDLLDLHEQAAGHLADLSEVRDTTAAMLDVLTTVPPGRRQRRAVHHALVTPVKAQRTRLALLPLVEAYRAALQRDDVADFATVAAQAARLAVGDPRVGEALRSQYRVVLLDEFQDTSHAQLELLHAVFGSGHAVTAVGDPFQSIYGWRGASADTVASFLERFGTRSPVAQRSLRTSFRNARRVLAVANHVAAPLRSAGQPVASLVPTSDAPAGVVRVAVHRTAAEEADAVAGQVDQVWRTDRSPSSAPPSVAVLVRRRDQIPSLEAALSDRGLPVEVVGLDGLLGLPEVADVVALLRLVADPGRGDALMRLLTGPRLAFGPRDLDRLARWVRRLGGEGEVGIVEVLERPPPPGWLSPPAEERLSAFGAAARRLRARLSRPVADVVADAVRVLGLDVETEARAARTGGVGSAHLERLVEEAAAFADLAPQAGLVELLGYLDAAERQERGLRRAVEVHLSSRVQVLTVHAAKGLEWDVVVVPGMCDGVFPALGRTGAAWVSDAGTLPYPLRGDAERLPRLDAGASDQSDLARRITGFVEDGREVDRDEERRLAYVAFTRARTVLLCHGYRWGRGVRALDPSPFLREVAEVDGVIVDRWVDDPGERPGPPGAAPAWPYDVLGRHRTALTDGAARVRAVRADGGAALRSPLGAAWAEEVDLLLAEREAHGARTRRVLPPSHLSASQLVALRRDPERYLAALRRPVPGPPNPRARAGTAFHAWVERRYGRPALLDLDELPGAADDGPVSEDLAELQRAFLASEWAERSPRDVEASFELVLGGTVIRGRADAVFDEPPGLLVVDWKTGPPPRDPEEVEARSVQLAVYRLAFAALHGLRPDQVQAAFHHVREGLTVRGADVGEDELVRLVGRVAAASGVPAGAR